MAIDDLLNIWKVVAKDITCRHPSLDLHLIATYFRGTLTLIVDGPYTDR